MKRGILAIGLALALASASAQQAQQQPTKPPASNAVLAVTLIFGASMYYFAQCFGGNCVPVPCWMTASCAKS